MADAVRVEGLGDFIADVRSMQPHVRKEIPKALKEGAKLVQRTGRPYVARKSGGLAADWRIGGGGKAVYLRNRKPYAGVIEFGGAISPKGTQFQISAQPSMTRALDEKQEQIVDAVGDALEAVAVRHGWR
jgi:phage gpG-like protein